MKSTLAQAKASRLPTSVGLPACDPRFTQLLNDACYRLSEAGRWWGTYKKLRICATDGCITWPREVKNVETVKLCNLGIPVRNQWYEFRENVRSPDTSDTSCDRKELLDRGTTPQHTDFSTTSKIRLYPASASDAGKKVLLQGLDGNEKPVRTLSGSNYIDGEYVTLASPSATSTYSFYAPGLTGAQKPVTNGRVLAYAVHPTTGVETLIAEWHPSETNPDYRRTFLNNLPTCTTGNDCEDEGDGCCAGDTSCSNVVVEAIVRVEFVPVAVDEDWLTIGNLQALQHGMRSIQHEEKNNYRMAETEWQRALRLLRSELDAYSPRERTIVNVQQQGTAKLSRVTGGFI